MEGKNYLKENINTIANIIVAVSAISSIFVTTHFAKKQLESSVEIAREQMQKADMRDSINSIAEVKIKDSELELIEDQLEYSKMLYDTQRFILQNQLKLMSEQNKMLNTQLELIEANRISSFSFILNDIYNNIQKELNNPENKEKKLSNELIGQIVSATKKLIPYKQLHGERYLSPERGQLLYNLLSFDEMNIITLLEILKKSSFTYSDLTGLDFRGKRIPAMIDLSYSSLIGQKTVLNGADFFGVFLIGADLRGTQALGTIFNGTTFWNADLRGASISMCDLRGAHFEGADLRNVEFGNSLVDSDFLIQISNLKDTKGTEDILKNYFILKKEYEGKDYYILVHNDDKDKETIGIIKYFLKLWEYYSNIKVN